MKKTFFFLSTLWISTYTFSASAQTLNTNFIVKVNSFACNNKKNSKVGSGSLLKVQNEIYVLTSDHVLFHGNKKDNACHRILYKGTPLDAELIAVNSMKGLALLRVNSSLVNSDALSINTFTYTLSIENSGFSSLLGYPSSSLTPIVDNSSQILNPHSSRKILPLTQQVLEVKGHSEYGMSGGAFLDYQGNFAGLLSHQYLQMNLGAPSTVKNYEENNNTEGELIALVISATEIKSWLDSVFSRKTNAEFRFDAAKQLKRNESFVIDGVRFSLANCNHETGAVGGEGAGIGGRAKMGGEGAGIGGNGEEEKICGISMNWANDSYIWSNPWPFAKAIWFEQLKEKLLSGASAEITGLFFQGTKLGLGSLIQVFSQIQKGAIPLIRLSSPFYPNTEVAEKIKIASIDAKKQLTKLQKLNPRDYDTIDFLKEAFLLTEALDNAQWEIAFSSNIANLLNTNVWNDLLQIDFTTSVALKSALLKIQAELEKLRI